MELDAEPEEVLAGFVILLELLVAVLFDWLMLVEFYALPVDVVFNAPPVVV